MPLDTGELSGHPHQRTKASMSRNVCTLSASALVDNAQQRTDASSCLMDGEKNENTHHKRQKPLLVGGDSNIHNLLSPTSAIHSKLEPIFCRTGCRKMSMSHVLQPKSWTACMANSRQGTKQKTLWHSVIRHSRYMTQPLKLTRSNFSANLFSSPNRDQS